MAGGEGGLVPHIEQRDFLAQQQRERTCEGVMVGVFMDAGLVEWT